LQAQYRNLINRGAGSFGRPAVNTPELLTEFERVLADIYRSFGAIPPSFVRGIPITDQVPPEDLNKIGNALHSISIC
jgi:hypothetical protein